MLYSLEQKDPSSFKYPHGIHKYINLEVNYNNINTLIRN